VLATLRSGRVCSSLPVVLDGVHVARLGGTRVLTKLALRSALSQQIPALVERLLQLREPLVLDSHARIPQSVLFFHQGPDPIQDVLITHDVVLLRWHDLKCAPLVQVRELRHHVVVTKEAWTSAEPYEPFMGRWSRLLAAEVVAWLDPPSELRWLDVGCGTGALSEAVLTQAAPISLVGVDPSAAYLAAAAARLADQPVTFKVGGAAELPLPDSSVDWVVSGLVLNFVPDALTAVGEMRRVLVSGGRVTAYVWDYATGMQMLRTFWDAAIAEDSAAASLDEGARFPICQPGGLRECFVDAGLDDVEARPIEVPTTFLNFDDYWTPFLGGQGPASGYCTALPEDARERLRGRLRVSLPAEPDGTIRLSARAWAVSGVSE
jgi:SAM-dependent methyltransferase